MSDLMGAGVLGALGSLGTSMVNMQSQRETNRLQEELSNTAVQRRVKDMEAAGLNPVLAAGNPAAVPAMVAPRAQDPLAAAFEGASKAQSIAQSGEQQRLLRIQADKADAERQGVALDNQLKSATLGARAAQVDAESQYSVRTLDNRVTQVFDDTQVKNTASYIAQLQAEWNDQRVKGQTTPDNLVQLQADFQAARIAAINQGIAVDRAQISAMAEAIQKSGMNAEALKALGIPPVILDMANQVLGAVSKAAAAAF